MHAMKLVMTTKAVTEISPVKTKHTTRNTRALHAMKRMRKLSRMQKTEIVITRHIDIMNNDMKGNRARVRRVWRTCRR